MRALAGGLVWRLRPVVVALSIQQSGQLVQLDALRLAVRGAGHSPIYTCRAGRVGPLHLRSGRKLSLSVPLLSVACLHRPGGDVGGWQWNQVDTDARGGSVDGKQVEELMLLAIRCTSGEDASLVCRARRCAV